MIDHTNNTGIGSGKAPCDFAGGGGAGSSGFREDAGAIHGVGVVGIIKPFRRPVRITLDGETADFTRVHAALQWVSGKWSALNATRSRMITRAEAFGAVFLALWREVDGAESVDWAVSQLRTGGPVGSQEWYQCLRECGYDVRMVRRCVVAYLKRQGRLRGVLVAAGKAGAEAVRDIPQSGSNDNNSDGCTQSGGIDWEGVARRAWPQPTADVTTGVWSGKWWHELTAGEKAAAVERAKAAGASGVGGSVDVPSPLPGLGDQTNATAGSACSRTLHPPLHSGRPSGAGSGTGEGVKAAGVGADAADGLRRTTDTQSSVRATRHAASDRAEQLTFADAYQLAGMARAAVDAIVARWQAGGLTDSQVRMRLRLVIDEAERE